MKKFALTFILLLVLCSLLVSIQEPSARADPNQLAFAIETVDKNVEMSTSIAIDSSDHPHISYYQAASLWPVLRYASYNGSSWIFETVDSDVGLAEGCSLDLDSYGYPHISYTVENQTGDKIFLNLKYAYFDGDSWIIQIVDSEAECFNPSIAVDSQNNPHIIYFEDKSKTLKYAHYNGSSWIIQTIESSGSTVWSQSIALDSYDNPHIVYSGTTDSVQSLKYAHHNGTSWNIETVDAEHAGYVSVALDSKNNLHISYRIGGLGYAYFDGVSWNIQTVPGSEGDNVSHNSIALDSKDNPHISYFNVTGGSSHRSLRYAYYDGVSWSVKTVDKGDVGYANSIALDSRDYPHISYVYFYGYSDVRYAVAGVSPMASFTYSPSDPIGGEIVSFNASTSSDSDGTIVNYAWDFGDGTTITVTDPIITHAYATAGNHTVTLTVTDSDGFDDTTAHVLTIVRLNSTISISLSSSTSYIGFKVEINGNLTCNEAGLSGASIVLSYSVTGGESWNDITAVDAASDGSYSAVWIPSATGNYLVRATWSGNATYWGTDTTVSLAVTPFEEQNVFSVSSNSTLSALTFNTTSQELAFTASGPSGTKGYVKVTIARSLVDDITNMKVYLDGNQTEYSIESMDDSWLLTFHYSHSSHMIVIELNPNRVPTTTLLGLEWWLWAIILVVVVGALTAAAFRLRRRKPPTPTAPALPTQNINLNSCERVSSSDE